MCEPLMMACEQRHGAVGDTHGFKEPIAEQKPTVSGGNTGLMRGGEGAVEEDKRGSCHRVLRGLREREERGRLEAHFTIFTLGV